MGRNWMAVVAALVLATVPAGHALADKPAVYTGVIDGVGAGGYDVVAYQDGKATPGSAAISAAHEGITYRFASEANLARFSQAPERYLPRFGGYCAWAVSQGYTAHGDPLAWSVVDGALYLNYSRSIRSRWERDIPGHIASGNANWPNVLD